jgi:SynChlorMet cassette radical SAM/SPASM protein ScmE
MRVMPTPRTVDLEITHRCNARCRYCYYLNNAGVVYADLPTRRWLDFFEELGRAAVMDVCLAGGEPLMREDIFELIGGIVGQHMRFQILTNGSLVTADTARRLKASGRCNSVQVSVDGSRAETHESMRGRGSFEPALRAVRLLRDAGLPVTVRVTVHAANVEDLPAVARLLLEELGLPSFSTNSISSLGTLSKYGEGTFLTPALRLRAMRMLTDLDKQYPGRIEASAGPLADARMFAEMERARAGGTGIAGRGKLVGCGCIFTRLSVRADGAYVPCMMLPQMVLGTIGVDPLEHVWRESAVFNALRGRMEIPLESFAECQGCEYIHACTGNCAGTALSMLGDANRPSPEACLRRFKEQLAAEGLAPW